MRSITTLSIAAMLAAATMTGAMAQTYSATNSASVDSGGENDSTSTLAAESATNPTDAGFGQFGVIDFSGTKAVSNVTGFTLNVTEYSGKYGQSGLLDFFLTSNTTPLTGIASEGFTYLGDGPTDGIGTQLGTLTSLGSLQYTALPYVKGMTTTINPNYTFNLTPAQQIVLASDLAAGDVKIAFGVSPGLTTATEIDGAGYVPKSGTYSAPTLTLIAPAAVPEASTTVSFGLLLALGLGGAVTARRRKVTTN